MQPKLQRRVQRYGWDKAMPHYEKFWQEQLKPAQSKLLAMAELKPGQRVLDVACGTGLVTFPAVEQVGSEGEIVGTDISEEMVTSARQIAAERGVHNATFARMDAEDLQVPESHFDVALCALGLMYVPDPVKGLQEMHGGLKDGGRTVAAVWGQRANCGWADIFPIVDSRVNSEVCPMFFQLGTGNALAMTFEAAGFKEIATERISTTLIYDSPEDACGAAFAGGPVALAYSRFDATTRAEAESEYLNSIESFRHGNGYRIPGEFVVTRGEKV